MLKKICQICDTETYSKIVYEENIPSSLEKINFSGRKTIIMIAHRITTVEQCDIIYLIEDGEVADQGNYLDL